MLQRFYVHNFRCLDNFELSLKDMSSALLIGKNGVGKSTIANALEVLQSMVVRFEANNTTMSVDFNDLSDGEKCFFLCAVVLAANKYNGPLFCFWDEPDNYLSLSDVGHFVMLLRRSFKNSGQILATSHNEEAIRKFSSENTFLLDRKSHLEPTLIRLVSEVSISGDLIDNLILGDAEL